MLRIHVKLPRRSSIRKSTARAIGARHACSLSLLLCLIALLCGCAANTGNRSQPARNLATATPLPQPVQIALASQVVGALSSHASHLVVTITIRNGLSDAIGIASQPCFPYPPVLFDLETFDSKVVWSWIPDDNCVLTPYYDVAQLAPHTEHSWVRRLDLSAATSLIPDNYSLVAYDVLWHTGSISATGEVQGQHGLATGKTTITLT